MAKEQATITFSLEDDFSAKMAEIVTKLEDFKRRLDETSKSGTEGFRKVAESVKGVGDHSAGANASLRSMSTYMKDAFENFNKSLATSVTGLGKFEATLATLGPSLRAFAGNFGRLGTSVGLVGGAAVTAAGSIWLLGRRLSEAYEETVKLERRFGATQQTIENIRRILSRGGFGEEALIRTMDTIRKHAQETREGTHAALYEGLYKTIADVGPLLAAETEKIFKQVRDGGLTPEEGYRSWLKKVYGVQTSEEVRRKMAEIIHIPFEQL